MFPTPDLKVFMNIFCQRDLHDLLCNLFWEEIWSPLPTRQHSPFSSSPFTAQTLLQDLVDFCPVCVDWVSFGMLLQRLPPSRFSLS
ncbi:hypothetical protein EPI10_032398 [Gossypium australe]|uniref:Uncharacterized protein n=1 Tax=Gossypium australe TaxID=47621 RepID=A0A5B6X689_9ROSI|nr:hypothetical protein EPI10_032398 [Gossypium australe]